MILLAFLLSTIPLVSATTVDLNVDKQNLSLGEPVRVTLALNSKEKISGTLSIINLDEKRQEALLFQSTQPGCSCRPDTRVVGDYTDSSTYTPKKAGNYQIRAYFDRIERTVNITVKEIELTTTTEITTTTPLLTSKKTTITTISNTKMQVTTSTREQYTTLAINEDSKADALVNDNTHEKSQNLQTFPDSVSILLILVVLIALIYIILKNRRR